MPAAWTRAIGVAPWACDHVERLGRRMERADDQRAVVDVRPEDRERIGVARGGEGVEGVGWRARSDYDLLGIERLPIRRGHR